MVGVYIIGMVNNMDVFFWIKFDVDFYWVGIEVKGVVGVECVIIVWKIGVGICYVGEEVRSGSVFRWFLIRYEVKL